MIRIVVLPIYLITLKATLVNHVTNGCSVFPSFVNTSCSTHCCCIVDRNNRTAAQCNIRGMNPSAMNQVRLPSDLFSLDLSSNGLNEIPKFLHKFPSIRVLSLANNTLYKQGFSFDSLRSLKHLKTLDLSNTSEKTTSINRYWKLATNQSIYKGVSRLEKIVIKDTFFANPSFWRYLLLSLPNIRQLIGVEWVAACDQCNISKVDAVQAVQLQNMLQNNSQHLSKMKLFYARGNTEADDSGSICAAPRSFLEWEASYESPRRFLSPGYMLQCYCSSSDCVTKRFKHLTDILRLVRILFNSLYFVGAVALTLNLVIVVIILGSKPLRKLPIMILIFNMAVCDMLMSVYCILIARYSVEVFQDSTFFNSLNLSKSFCRAKVFIFTVAQNVSVINSVLATIEKYLVIVYPMKPGRRITKKISLISMCVTWFVSIGYSVDAVFYLSEKDEKENNSIFNYFYCSASGRHIFQVPFVASNQQVKMAMPLSLFIGVLYSFFFLCTVPLYIHIYIVVKKSSTQMGVKREGVLARKLALLVFTNFIFSVVPLSLAPLVSSRNLLVLDFFNPLMRTYHSFQAYLICIVWLPVLLLSLNCCLNPFLFTFRHHRFQMEFRHFASKCINKV